MATTKVTELNRLILAKGGSTTGSTECACLKILAKVIDDVDVPDEIITNGEALKYWADILTGSCLATVAVKDSVSKEAIASPAVTIKTGSTVGSGTAISPTLGKYPLPEGAYNYSVSASGYVTKTGTFSITEAQVINGTITLEVLLVADE